MTHEHPARRELVADPEPRCDICDKPMTCERGEDCTVHAGDWNGETGNHRSCEARADAPAGAGDAVEAFRG